MKPRANRTSQKIPMQPRTNVSPLISTPLDSTLLHSTLLHSTFRYVTIYALSHDPIESVAVLPQTVVVSSGLPNSCVFSCVFALPLGAWVHMLTRHSLCAPGGFWGETGVNSKVSPYLSVYVCTMLSTPLHSTPLFHFTPLHLTPAYF